MDEKYTKSVLIRIKPTQLEQFQRHAKLAGKSVSEWLRDLGAAAVCPPDQAAVERIAQEVGRRALLDLASDNPSPQGLEFLKSNPQAEAYRNLMGLENNRHKDEIENGLAVGRGYIRLENDPEESGPNITLVNPDGGRRQVPIQASVGGLRIGKTEKLRELAASIPGLMVGISPSQVFTDPEIPKALEQLAAMNPPPGFLEDRYHDEVGRDPLTKIFFSEDTPEEPVRSWAEEFARCRKLGDFGAEAFGEATEHIKKWPKGFKNWNEQKQVAWLDEHYALTDTKGDGW